LWLFRLLRKLRPVAIPFGNFMGPVVVAKATDIRDVLNRMEDFTVADVLGRQMPWGPFLIGIDWPEQHKRELKLLRSVVDDADADEIRNRVANKCQELLKKVECCGSIDVVADLCDPVVVDTLNNYFGVPIVEDEQKTAAILGRIASFVMVDPPVGSQIRINALDSVTRITKAIFERIETQIKNAELGQIVTSDLLTRLVVKLKSERPSFFNEDWIRRYITGLAVFGGGTITRATTHAIDRLLDKHLVGTKHFARACELAKEIEDDIGMLKVSPSPAQVQKLQDNRLALRKIIYEALRFRPMLPLLVRYTPRETVIGKGSPHSRLVPAGKTVIAAPIAAMFDPSEFESPMRFKIDRSMKKYMHFGPDKGPRHCFGEYVADVVMFEIIRTLLLRNGLKRESSIQYVESGPAPASLIITFA
jgi:cytochrome P450